MDIQRFNADVEVLAKYLETIDSKVKDAYEKSCKGDWSCLKDIEPLKWLGAFYTHCAISEALLHNLAGYGKKSEKDVYEWFYKNFEKVLGKDFQLVRKKEAPKSSNNRPDIWVMTEDGEMIPVECKLDKFTDRSLKQLKRYMEHFNSEHGIAVGKELACELPENICFVRHPI